jgi:hypothetical protein
MSYPRMLSSRLILFANKNLVNTFFMRIVVNTSSLHDIELIVDSRHLFLCGFTL